MDVDETTRILANLYDTCDRCGELTGALWPDSDNNRLICAACRDDLGGGPDGD